MSRLESGEVSLLIYKVGTVWHHLTGPPDEFTQFECKVQILILSLISFVTLDEECNKQFPYQ